ncbi:MAG: DNA polymerase III subunit beta [Bacteroidetes bacterium]|jgi:DNA polymerase-3 subunit beta|nr:DNA polymerase III subunit beta [Bacteroidota bacterium]
MKFIASSSTLLKKLSQLSGVVGSNAVIPILEYFLFEVEPGILVITATDLETSMQSSIPVESKETCRIAVPAKLIIDFLKTLPEQPITFTINPDNNNIELTSDKGRYKISGETADDFPRMAQVERGDRVEFNVSVLQNVIYSTLFATSNNELRPSMTGVLFEMVDGKVNWVATDSNKLVRYSRTDIVFENNSSFVVPKRVLNVLKSVLPNEDVLVQLQFGSNNAQFKFNDFVLVCRLIDDKFPNYGIAFPADSPFTLTINRQELLGSLKRMANFSNKSTYQVILKLAGNELHISAQDIDFSNEAFERLPCEYDGQDMEIGFSARFLGEMLGVVDTEEVKIMLSEPSRPGIITPADASKDEELTMLLMPIVLLPSY